MKKSNITTTIGTINLNNIEFCENTLDVFIGIESVSADIQKKINEAVKMEKDKFAWRWKNKDVRTDISLWIHIQNKEVTYCISVDIIDKKNDSIFTDVEIDVDLSEYQNELKKVIVKAMIDKFF